MSLYSVVVPVYNSEHTLQELYTRLEKVFREVIKEEFELNIKANKYITNNVCEYPTKTVDLRLYECEYISGEFKLHDHSEYKWVNINELLNYDLAPADIPLAKYLKEL